MIVLSAPDAPAAVGPYSAAVRPAGSCLLLRPDGRSTPRPAPSSRARWATRRGRCSQHPRRCWREGLGLARRVVKTTVFLPTMDDFQAMNAVYADAFGDHRPARCTIAVAGLPLGARVEIEVIAGGRGRRWSRSPVFRALRRGLRGVRRRRHRGALCRCRRCSSATERPVSSPTAAGLADSVERLLDLHRAWGVETVARGRLVDDRSTAPAHAHVPASTGGWAARASRHGAGRSPRPTRSSPTPTAGASPWRSRTTRRFDGDRDAEAICRAVPQPPGDGG